MDITKNEAREIGKRIGIDWAKADFSLDELFKGIQVESEHGSKLGKGTNVGGDDKNVAARIAWAHLKELPDYYKRLHKMEAEGEKALEEKTANGDEEEEESPGKKVDPAVVAKWFKANPNPNDDQVHDFAEERGYNTHSLESVIYRAATKGYKSAAASCKTPEKKIRSGGEGQGLARGDGKGPMGKPIGKKDKEKEEEKKRAKMNKSAAYNFGVKLALEDLGLTQI